MSKKIVLSIMLLVLCLTLFVGCTNKDVPTTLMNGSFEDAVDETVKNWKLQGDGGVSATGFKFEANIKDTDQYDERLGERYLYVDKSSPISGKEYLGQQLQLKKGKTYKMSALIKVDKINATNNNSGVRVGFAEDDEFDGILVNTVTNSWVSFEQYFKVDTDKPLTFIITVGGKKGSASASFGIDNVKLEEVKTVPEEVKVVPVVSLNIDKNLATPQSVAFVAVLAILTVFIAYGLYFVLRKVNTPNELLPVKSGNKEEATGVAKALISPLAVFIYILLGAFVVRFIIMMLSYGFNGTVDKLANYVALIKQNGFLSILTGDTGFNQPVGVVYILALLQLIGDALNIEAGSLGYSILLRIPNLLADLVICYMIYNYSQNRLSDKHAAVYTAIYAFFPIFFIFGGLYASTLPIAIAFIMAAFMAMIGEKDENGKAQPNYITSGVYYTLGLLFSNYMLLVLPAILVFQIYALVTTEKKEKLEVAFTMAFSLVFFFLMTLAPCYKEITNGNVIFYFKQMYASFKTQTFLSLDTFNLYAIFGKGNLMVRSTIFEVFNWLFVLTMFGGMAYAYCSKKGSGHNDEADTNLLLMTSLIIAAYSILGANAVVGLLPISLVLMLLYLALKPEKRLYNIFTGLSVLSFLNIAGILSINGVITNIQTDKVYKFAPTDAFFITFSVFAVALVFYYLYVGISMVLNDEDRVELPLYRRKFIDEMKYIVTFEWIKNLKKRNN